MFSSSKSGNFSFPYQHFRLGRVCRMALCFPARGNCACKYSVCSFLLYFSPLDTSTGGERYVYAYAYVYDIYVCFICFTLPLQNQHCSLFYCNSAEHMQDTMDHNGLCVVSKDLTVWKMAESGPIAVTTPRASLPL